MAASSIANESIPDINEITPIDDNDRACLSEIRDVLNKHGKLSRFGVTLLHKHFPLLDNEELVEQCDPSNRTLTIRPRIKSSDGDARVVQTSWRLTNDEAMLVCETNCDRNPTTGAHTSVHWKSQR